MIKQPEIFKNVTRLTTAEERAQIERIDLSDADVEALVQEFRRGLIKAVSTHESAVQNNFSVSTEVAIRMSRPVLNPETDQVEDVVGRETITAPLSAQKKYKN